MKKYTQPITEVVDLESEEVLVSSPVNMSVYTDEEHSVLDAQ